MTNIKNMLKDKKFWFFTLISILFFGALIKIQYATDTYVVFENSTMNMIKHFISSGRFITAIAYFIIKVLHIGNAITYLLSFLMAVICTSVAIYKLENILNNDIKSGVIAIISSIMIIINIFSIELFLFIEMGILMLSVLFCVLAFEHVVKYFEGNKKTIIAVLVYMFLANFSYQGTVGLFVGLSLLYIVKHTKDIKSFVMNTFKTALFYGIPAFLNYAIVRFIFANTRVSAANDIMLSINKVLHGTKEMIITTYNIIPKYLYIAVLIGLFIVISYCIMSSKLKRKNKMWLLFGMCYIILGNLVATIFPQLMQSTDSIWFVPRSTYTFASLIGILIVYLFMNVDVDVKIEKVLTIVLIIYLAIQYVGFQNIIRDRYILNYMDKYEIMQIKEKIDVYEKETNNKVTKISFYTENNNKYSYPDLYVNQDTNIKAAFPEWSRLNSINYFLNRKLEETDNLEEIYNKYFKGKSWDFYNNDQVVINEDTIHIYIY